MTDLNSFSLSGKIALVTGASYGIGLRLHQLMLNVVQQLYLTILTKN